MIPDNTQAIIVLSCLLHTILVIVTFPLLNICFSLFLLDYIFFSLMTHLALPIVCPCHMINSST